ncbi:TetR/AcrR family transcriptional regulator [Roseibium alexandrii]|jgi:AcrR family transcriptional regulator|uniref:Putative transcriptional regulator n=1 Tax=Roseibium alexandrii TaxID=388408 RepID=A0A0M7A315_9HYPH|nr:TetR/AcrR family transcriptional regulator [Roseibium alexandrii]CTQ69007.1 putative transcriptional regulator [Roseibium alexandrii]
MRPSKRDELVHKAQEIFDRDGFQATGMDALVAETGISKTTMFKHFRNKDELILATLRLRDETFRNWMHRKLDRFSGVPDQQLLAVFDLLQEWFDQPDFHGCLFIKAASEFSNGEAAIPAQAREHKRLLLNDLIGLAKAAGADFPDQLGRQLMLLIEGAIVAARMGYSQTPARDAHSAAAVLIAKSISK